MIYKKFMQKNEWETTLYPLQSYCSNLHRAGQSEYLSFIADDLRALIANQKFKGADKSISAEENKKLQN